MYSKFNYKPSQKMIREFLKFKNKGTDIYSKFELESRKCLKEFIKENGHINGDDIKDHWFQVQKADIFISHSHQNLEEVKAFAGWLHEEFGLNAFIDSCSWGYCDDLLREIDQKFSYNEASGLYDYRLRNYTTSHVHTMLSLALTEMIDKCECVIFFNTPESINISTAIDEIRNEKQVTISPWIYHELSMASMVQQTFPERYPIPILEHSGYFLAKSDFKVDYDVTKYLNSMSTLSDDMLTKWKDNNRRKGPETLDDLYKIAHQENSIGVTCNG